MAPIDCKIFFVTWLQVKNCILLILLDIFDNSINLGRGNLSYFFMNYIHNIYLFCISVDCMPGYNTHFCI